MSTCLFPHKIRDDLFDRLDAMHAQDKANIRAIEERVGEERLAEEMAVDSERAYIIRQRLDEEIHIIYESYAKQDLAIELRAADEFYNDLRLMYIEKNPLKNIMRLC